MCLFIKVGEGGIDVIVFLVGDVCVETLLLQPVISRIINKMVLYFINGTMLVLDWFDKN